MFILFDHTNYIAYYGKTLKAIEEQSGLEKHKMVYALRKKRQVRWYSVVKGVECKLKSRMFKEYKDRFFK